MLPRTAGQTTPPKLSLALRKSIRSLGWKVSLASWNIDAFSLRPITRAKLLLGHLLDRPQPLDVIFLQKVTTDVRAYLLSDARVRADYFVTDFEEPAVLETTPFANMTLLSSARFVSDQCLQEDHEDTGKAAWLTVSRAFHIALPSKSGRMGLCVDVGSPTTQGSFLRLINVHLDSLGDSLQYRAQQISILARLLRASGCGGGVIAGDFNAISPQDHDLLQENGLLDAWLTLHGPAGLDGHTWGVGAAHRSLLESGRLNKMATMELKHSKPWTSSSQASSNYTDPAMDLSRSHGATIAG